jgi:hypothetical protein
MNDNSLLSWRRTHPMQLSWASPAKHIQKYPKVSTSKKACSNFLYHRSWSLNNYLKDLGSKFVIAFMVIEIRANEPSKICHFDYKRVFPTIFMHMYVSIYLFSYYGNLFENGGFRKHPFRHLLYLKFYRLFIWTLTSCSTKFQVSLSILTCIFWCLNTVILGFFT